MYKKPKGGVRGGGEFKENKWKYFTANF